MTSDAQAALAAAAQVMVAMIESSTYGDDKTPYQIEQHTCQMATGLLYWFQNPARNGARPAPADERLVPNEDFKSPSHALTERIDATAVLAAAHLADRVPRSPGASYAGVHVLAPEPYTTPSGKRACQCGQAWPCSQRTDDRPEAAPLSELWR